ncbi:zinc-binding dehydrogenase [Anaerotalea alkaliphila]|uniref:zinc-binding dehydrogenase n=1 Tax=Anaerotalea alkaliphila TaxID=2662126 RepID=UPI0031B61A56
MRTRAASLYGKKDIRIREFELPEISDDELLVKVVSNSLCLSTYKAAILGEDHKRVPETIQSNPIMTGHECSGVIEEVGSNLKDRFHAGERFVLQPAMGLDSGYSAGYSYEHFGGNATYMIIPKIAIDLGCVLSMKDDYFANASLSEPMSCIIGAFNASYHTTPYVYEHEMGIKEGGSLALLGCAGPMGIGAIDYAINGKVKPKRVVVTDINQNRLDRAKQLVTEEEAAEKGIELTYVNTSGDGVVDALMELSGGRGYDDVFVFAPVTELLVQADEILGNDGCLNFFAGPTDKQFKVPFNFYNVHYASTHLVGTSGGSTGDMIESLELSAEGKINPSYMITHIGGLNAAPHAILHLNEIPGGKKVIYPHIEMELTAIADFEELGKTQPLFRELHLIVEKNNGIWCKEAERHLLKYAGASGGRV